MQITTEQLAALRIVRDGSRPYPVQAIGDNMRQAEAMPCGHLTRAFVALEHELGKLIRDPAMMVVPDETLARFVGVHRALVTVALVKMYRLRAGQGDPIPACGE